MNIALVSQYFWPEQFVIINDLVKELSNQGHKVYVLTGKPNYPNGEVFPGYSEHSEMSEEYIPGVEVFRAPLRARGKSGAKNLFLNYLSFVTNGIKYFPRAIKERDIDVILALSMSPVTAVIPAIQLKRHTKAHLAVWVQDLWPESLKATGYVKNRFVLWLVQCMVRWIYSRSDTVLVQSKSFITQIAKLTSKNKVFYYPNSIKIDNAPDSKAPSISRELIDVLETNQCFIFAGNLGTVQALDTLLDAAKKLGHLEKFKLVLVGSGSYEANLQKRIQDENIEQVVIAGRFPIEQMPEFFNRATALIVSLNDNKIISYTIPSKVQAYLAAGRPIIASLNGEGAQVIDDAGAGFSCPAEDANALAACMEKLYFMKEPEREALGAAGKAYFMEHFNMESQAQRLVELLNERIKK